MHRSLIALAFLMLASRVGAQTEAESPGQVELPLAVYNQLVETARDPARLPRGAPAGYALGSAKVTVTVAGDGPRPSAEVRVELGLEVLEDDWVLIPVLPAGTPVESVTVGGSAVQLISTPQGLAWAARKQGSFVMSLRTRLDAARSETGLSLAVPLPEAASITLSATLPGTGLDVAVIPSAGTRIAATGKRTRVSATVPSSRGVQLSWRLPAGQGHSLSRASYVGELTGEAVSWRGELIVDLMSDETITLPLLPSRVTLKDLEIDGRDAPILIEGDRFATLIAGRGRHTVTAGFEVPVQRRDGPPRIDLDLPEVPVSRFELTLPGKKEVTVTAGDASPGTRNVESRRRGGSTVAVAHVPLSSRVAISWAEAVPEEVRAEVRANAAVYHAVHAEEGVLYVRALADYEVTRGETNVLRLEVPAGVQVERVSASGAVADWRLGEVGDEAGSESVGPVRELSVFLDRQLQGRLVVELDYDVSIAGRGTGQGADQENSDEIVLPLLRAIGAQRQRGMIALLSGPDLTLAPVVADEAADGTAADGATRVGENQLPAFVRQAIELGVAHTFKYVESPPRLAVTAAVPERQQGRFDVAVDSLISLGEVTLKGSASVEVDVKSGRLSELALVLPATVNLLSLSGPSVRQHKVEPSPVDGGGNRVAVEFTQEMEGRFRLEVAYERILEAEAEVEVPVLDVAEAEVEQGRIAVEALAAVEVQPGTVEQLTSLDANELPQQLILRTTNPILHAYKYVSSPHRLTLTVDRHEVVEVHEAALDEALYRTLFTRDGLSVTTARFTVRNSRRQFLSVKLPAGSEIWSVFVDGRPEKPARKLADDGSVWHLIKIIHSTVGFPVEIVYETPAGAIKGLGMVSAVLPRPEILVTQTRWDVFVPEGVEYGAPSEQMVLVANPQSVSAADVEAEMAELRQAGGRSGGQVIEPLRPLIPQAGVHFAFEKLYANQGGRDAGFEIPYASGFGRTLGRFLSFLGAALLWIGLAFLARGVPRLGSGLAVLGLLLLAVLSGHYQLSPAPAVWLTVILLLALGTFYGRSIWQRQRSDEA